MKYFFLLNLIFHTFITFSQINEDFTDSDITNNPTWNGSISNYLINSSLQLQSTNTVASTTFLTTPHNLVDIDAKEWHFWIKQSFSPSANNYSKIYLTSNNSDLSVHPDGYYLQFGETGSLDAIRLFKQENNVSTEILSGTASEIASSFAISVKIIRESNGDWSLFVDPSGGTTYIFESTANDPSNLIGSYFGIQSTYTVSDASKFYYDNIYVGPKIVDLTPPSIQNTTIINGNQVDVYFNEPLDQTSAELINNYVLAPSINISLAQLDATNLSLVHLALSSPLVNGTTYSLISNGVSDLAGNPCVNQQINFSYFVNETAQKGDVLINEIMADPSPSAGLPEVEYIEIINISQKYFDLSNWKVGDASGFGTIQHAWLAPGEIKILCSSSSLSDYPSAISVSNFPSYNNAGDHVEIRDANNVILDSLTYSDSWYQDAIKKEGGYSLERIRLTKMCSDENNWNSSIASIGGTPGLQNSIFQNNIDTVQAKINSILVLSSNEIQIQFSKLMDSSSFINSNISTQPFINESNVTLNSNFSNTLNVQFSDQIIPSKWYTIQLNQIKDCWQNISELSKKFALTEEANSKDIVINEILYNPLSGGSDFVELFNNSSKIIDLKGYTIANTTSNKVIENQYILDVNDYVILSKDSLFILENYPATVANKFIQMDLPSFNIDSGSVNLYSTAKLIDRLSYKDSWQFSLLGDTKGKSLEKINPNLNNDSTNWHTAAETVGFATPGRINSEYIKEIESSSNFLASSKIISPDNDGIEDVLEISYQLPEPDMLGTITVFDLEGRIVKKVLKNELMATKGTCFWDGITEENIKAPIGIYVVYIQCFNTQGNKKIQEKLAVTVAGKI